MPDTHLLPAAAVRMKERQRLSTLGALDLLDTPPEREFDCLVGLAREALGCSIALISLVDAKRQWFKAKLGLDVAETARDISFCTHAIQADDMLVVPDALNDARFADNPLVLGAPHVRFYAGVPIRADNPGIGAGASAIGTLCVIDEAPRELHENEAQVLRDLARYAETLIRARSNARTAAAVAADRQALLQDLDRAQRQLSQVEQVAGAGTWRLSIGDRCATWSRRVLAMHGLPPDGTLSFDAAMAFCPPAARVAFQKALDYTISTGAPLDFEADLMIAAGTRHRARCLGEIELRNGVPTAVIGVVQIR